MTRLLTIFWADLRCHWYLLTQGMWRREHRLVTKTNDRIVEISTMKGSLYDLIVRGHGAKITRIFYEEKK